MCFFLSLLIDFAEKSAPKGSTEPSEPTDCHKKRGSHRGTSFRYAMFKRLLCRELEVINQFQATVEVVHLVSISVGS